MIDKPDQRRLMEQYLFGELSADARAEFEGAYLRDNDIFQQLVSVENEMIDRYVLDELSAPEKKSFDRSLLSNPARREMVETARALLNYCAAAESAMPVSSPEPKKEWWRPSRKFHIWGAQFGVAAVLLLAITGICWLALTNRRLTNELEELRRGKKIAAQEKQALREKVESLHADLEQRDKSLQQIAESPPYDRGTVFLTLGPGLSRGSDEMASLIIPARASLVSLHMIIGRDPHPHYNVSVTTPDGRLVWNRGNIKGQPTYDRNNEIAVTLPSLLLQEGDYVVRVSVGNTDVGQDLAGYVFHVIRR
jgi:anti-sigma-K factor RskA